MPLKRHPVGATKHLGVRMIPELPGAVPEIPVSDVTAASTYYRDNLSFSLDWIAADIDLAGISRDHCRLFLAGPPFRKERGNVSPVLTWLNLSSKAGLIICTRHGMPATPSCCPRPNQSPGVFTSSPLQIPTATSSACSTTLRPLSANGLGPPRLEIVPIGA